MDLSEMEQAALVWLKGQGGSVLVTCVPATNTRGVFGMEPGLSVFKKLAKKGLVIITEEEPVQLDDGSWFTFTPSIDLA
jgi:hypothetical protein